MMDSYSVHTYIFISAAQMMIYLVMGSIVFLPGIDKWSKRYFIAFYSINMLDLFAFLLDMINIITPRIPAISGIMIYLEYLFLSFLPVILTIYLLHCCNEDWLHSPVFRTVTVLWVAFFIMLGTTLFSPIIYSLKDDLTFQRGKLHSLLLIPVYSIMIVNLITLIIKRKKLSPTYFFAFMIHIVSFTIVLILHSFYYVITALNIGILIGAFTMHVLILKAQIEKYISAQSDIANQKASIMVLQMRPHFIYNAMTSIYYLCDQNPKKAQQIILDFISYLRKNFSAIVSEELIPFNEELEHIRAYLAIEIAQFEDNLSVKYDIPHTQFLLPPLTLQPLVENSIKHALDPDSDPLHIIIQTRKSKKESIITVQDNGPGFDPSNVFNSDNALSNIKQRLEYMCRGSITIISNKNTGTTVQITIPVSEGDGVSGPL